MRWPREAIQLALLGLAAYSVEPANAASSLHRSFRLRRSAAIAQLEADRGSVAPEMMRQRLTGTMCLNNGTGVPCVDPHDPFQCKPGASEFPAISFTFDQKVPWKFDEVWCQNLRRMADAMNADLVLLLPSKSASANKVPIPPDTMKYLREYFRIVRTPWVVPPNLSDKVPREGGCCGAREFMKLNALGLEEYDAIINLDTDITVHGSLRPLFDCAASGRFLTARGSKSGVNGGMFTVRPSKALLHDVLQDLSVSSSSDEHGWNNLGLAPGANYGQAGLQGFLYYYFYQRNIEQKHVTAGQVHPCSWTGAIFCEISACEVTPLRHKIRCPSDVAPPAIKA